VPEFPRRELLDPEEIRVAFPLPATSVLVEPEAERVAFPEPPRSELLDPEERSRFVPDPPIRVEDPEADPTSVSRPLPARSRVEVLWEIRLSFPAPPIRVSLAPVAVNVSPVRVGLPARIVVWALRETEAAVSVAL
jgi:hypothetical protein